MTEEEFMLTAVLQCKRDEIPSKKNHLTPEQIEQLDVMRKRRVQGEPLQYVVGSAPFMDFEVRVTPDVLIPRPETEILVDELIRSCKPTADSCQLNILDIGTGSGVIAIALKRAFSYAMVTAWDISERALAVARENAQRLGVDICFEQCDLFQVDSSERYDVIVSNPPYIRTEDMAALSDDVQQEPVTALDGGQDGLDYYRHLIPKAAQWLKPRGLLALEMGDDQADSVCRLLEAESYKNIQFIEDYVRTRRHVFATIPTVSVNGE